MPISAGGYGLAVARLDSGKVIVTYVASGSEAERAMAERAMAERAMAERAMAERAMAGEDVQLSYAVAWIKAQAGGEPAPTPKAAAGWVIPLAAIIGLVVWFGRR